MNEKIDINYIAKKANVSRSTVSRVLTKKTNVKESTREKVEQVMAELNYHPNSMARGLATGKQNIIALVVSDIRNPFYAQLVWTISTSLREKGYLMTLYNSADMTRKDRESLWSLLDYGFSGLIMADARKEDDFSQFLKQADCPIVLVNRTLGIANTYDTITLDNMQGGYLATKHLLELGHRRIAMLHNMQGGYLATKHLLELGHRRIAMLRGPEISTTSQGRYEGYVYALQEAGIPLDKTLIRAGKLNMEFGREFAKKIILHSDNPPSAVFVGGDFTCYGLMDACIRAGIRIPEDLSIVSFDDIPFSDTAMVNLTTISHPYTQIGELVAKKIVHRIEHPDAPVEQITLLPTLVKRGSTAPYKK